ncbi:MAG: homocysteine S-methyltransferase family protein [Rubrobacteraceae bacterium]
MARGILEKLAAGVVLGDGGYLLELERRGHVQAGPFVPEVSLTRPEALAELHREFVGAGVDVIQTLTFYATEDKMATVGLGGQMENLNRAATRVARQVAGEADRDVLVAGNLSETWAYDPEDPASHRHVRELFDRQLAVMGEEGVDFSIAETFLWLGEALIAVEAIKDAGLPAMVTMTFDDDPISYEGLSPAECARRLADAGADITGFNCLRSPEHSYRIMSEMREAVPPEVHLATQPVAFHGPDAHPNFTSLPEFPFELENITLPRTAMGDFAAKARDMGYGYIGSCCGSVACHVREMARVLGKVSAEERQWRSQSGRAMSGYELHQPEGT